MTYSWYKSKTVWSIILMFVVGGLQAISSSISPSLAAALLAVLGACGTYFHISMANNVGAIN